MIVEEILSETRVRHYSDQGMMIRQTETGTLYEDAEDNIPCRYTYEEIGITVHDYNENLLREEETHG